MKPTTPHPAPENLTPADKSRIESRLRYLAETNARMAEVQARARNAKHRIRFKEHAEAAEELLHVINEARRLRLHLAAWDSYVS